VSTKYISQFPKPVLADLLSGRWLPVIGAGMSLNATLPVGKKMPLWADLGKTVSRGTGGLYLNECSGFDLCLRARIRPCAFGGKTL
jgi:hypothetical protein